jgi:hypothetical protein
MSAIAAQESIVGRGMGPINMRAPKKPSFLEQKVLHTRDTDMDSILAEDELLQHTRAALRDRSADVAIGAEDFTGTMRHYANQRINLLHEGTATGRPRPYHGELEFRGNGVERPVYDEMHAGRAEALKRVMRYHRINAVSDALSDMQINEEQPITREVQQKKRLAGQIAYNRHYKADIARTPDLEAQMPNTGAFVLPTYKMGDRVDAEFNDGYDAQRMTDGVKSRGAVSHHYSGPKSSGSIASKFGAVDSAFGEGVDGADARPFGAMSSSGPLRARGVESMRATDHSAANGGFEGESMGRSGPTRASTSARVTFAAHSVDSDMDTRGAIQSNMANVGIKSAVFSHGGRNSRVVAGDHVGAQEFSAPRSSSAKHAGLTVVPRSILKSSTSAPELDDTAALVNAVGARMRGARPLSVAEEVALRNMAGIGGADGILRDEARVGATSATRELSGAMRHDGAAEIAADPTFEMVPDYRNMNSAGLSDVTSAILMINGMTIDSFLHLEMQGANKWTGDGRNDMRGIIAQIVRSQAPGEKDDSFVNANGDGKGGGIGNLLFDYKTLMAERTTQSVDLDNIGAVGTSNSDSGRRNRRGRNMNTGADIESDNMTPAIVVDPV